MFSLKKIALLCILPLLFAFSCKKKDATSGPTTIQGQVVDITNGNTIANANTELIQIDYSQRSIIGGTPNSGLTVLQKKVTDANGNFSYNFNPSSNYGYEVFAWKDNYVNDPQYAVKVDKIPGKSNIDVKLQPYAYAIVHLKNISPNDASDRIDLNVQRIGSGYPSIYGDKVDTTLGYFQMLGNVTNTVNWFVTKNGTQTHFSRSIFFKKLDTTLIEITY